MYLISGGDGNISTGIRPWALVSEVSHGAVFVLKALTRLDRPQDVAAARRVRHHRVWRREFGLRGGREVRAVFTSLSSGAVLT